MSIAINSNFERDQYVASFTGQVNFVYSFPIFSDTYLTVYKYAAGDTPDDPTQILTLGVDYTVTGVGEAEGGTIILTVGATMGDIITIVGTQPIDRESVFQDLNPFTVALNQQLNELTVMVQQGFTYWSNITPHYNFDELISTTVRPYKLILPMLPDGHVWVGRGSLGTIPDDITTEPFSSGGGVTPAHPGMRPSIALWTGTDFVLTDSDLNIVGNFFVPTAGMAPDLITGFDNGWGAMHWPAHPTADRPAGPSNGDTYYDTDTNQFFGFLDGAWVPFGTGEGGTITIINQDTTGLTVGDWVSYSVADGFYVPAIATTPEFAEVSGVVLKIIVNGVSGSFALQQSGYIPSGTPGFAGPFDTTGVYFLSDTVAGLMTLNEPTINGHVRLPVFRADATDSGWVIDLKTGVVVGAPSPIPPGGSGGTGVTTIINQDTTGLTVGDWVSYDIGGGLYIPGLADTPEHAEISGVVLNIIINDVAGQFTLQQAGYIPSGTPGFSGFSTTGVYFLSSVNPGEQTLSEPTINGQVRLPVFRADSSDSGWVIDLKTGVIVGAPSPIPGNDNPNVIEVDQPGNDFLLGEWLYVSGDGIYDRASATDSILSQSVGAVIATGDPIFKLQFSGYNTNTFVNAVDATGAPILVSSTLTYYLSEIVPGAMCPTQPLLPSSYSKPVFTSESSTDVTGYILPQRTLPLPSVENSNIITIIQVAHGFLAGEYLRVLSDNTYTRALADSAINTIGVGFVIEVIDADTFILQTSGFCSNFVEPVVAPVNAFTPAAEYFLSDTVAGAIQIGSPAPLTSYSKPVLIALNATTAYIEEQRPLLNSVLNPSGGGGIIQVVYNVINTLPASVLTVNSTWVNITPVTISITPTSVASKVMVMFQISWGFPPNQIDVQTSFRLTRNGTPITAAICQGVTLGATVSNLTRDELFQETYIMYVDEPASTSSLTYSVQFWRSNLAPISGPRNFQLNQGVGISGAPAETGITTLILQEIA